MENSNGSAEGNSNGSAEGSPVARKNLRVSGLSCEKDSTNCAKIVQECQKTEPKCPKWTNAKHSSYLKSLETSFVNQLYDSMDNRGRECTSEYRTSEQKHSVITTPSGQYKVFQDGSWTRISFRRERPQLKQAYESGNILSNPWIQHYRLPCNKGSTVTDQAIVEENAEATDQNFIEEASEEEKEGRKRDNKCRKVLVADDFRHDQVVPLCKLPLLGDVTQGHGSLKE